jgi:hypothetical protein
MECGGKRSATPLSFRHNSGVALRSAALHNFVPVSGISLELGAWDLELLK